MKQKLCYVMPSYDSAAATHFAYLEEFVRRLSQIFDVFLVVERGAAPAPSLGCTRIRVAASRSSCIRLLKEEMFLWEARFWGCRRFYVHYSFYAAYVASWIARTTGGRTFYWNCGEPWKYRQPFLRRVFQQIVYRLIHTLVTGTEGLAGEYAAHYRIPRGKIRVMGNWIDAEKFKVDELRTKLNIPRESKVVLFVHRLSRRKGAHLLPQIARRLIDVKDFVLLIIGDGPERRNLELEIRNFPPEADPPLAEKLEGKVRFLGWIPHKDLADYYGISDAFLMPSEEEGFPHVLLEAMAAGVPFAASDVGGVREIIPSEMRPYLVSAGDTAAYAARLKTLFALTPEERAALGRACMTWVRRYDITNALVQFREIIT